MPMLKPYRAAPDTWVLPAYLPVPGLGLITVNSYLIQSQEPALIDTGMPVVRQDFQEALWSLIEPRDLRWVFLTHDDGDHVGSLIEVLGAATNARLVTQFIGYARLETSFHITAGPACSSALMRSAHSFRNWARTCATFRHSPMPRGSPSSIAATTPFQLGPIKPESMESWRRSRALAEGHRQLPLTHGERRSDCDTSPAVERPHWHGATAWARSGGVRGDTRLDDGRIALPLKQAVPRSGPGELL